MDARDIFPTEHLLDHVPALILEIGAYLRQPEDGAIAANTAILDKARELGSLRHAQRASLHQVLREYQVLSGVLVTFVVEEMKRLVIVPPPAEIALLVSRLHQAVDVLSQATVEAFVTLYAQTIDDQRERLEQFTRMAATMAPTARGPAVWCQSARPGTPGSRTNTQDARNPRAERPAFDRTHAKARDRRPDAQRGRQPYHSRGLVWDRGG